MGMFFGRPQFSLQKKAPEDLLGEDVNCIKYSESVHLFQGARWEISILGGIEEISSYILRVNTFSLNRSSGTDVCPHGRD
jgi:hypothetical protein